MKKTLGKDKKDKDDSSKQLQAAAQSRIASKGVEKGAATSSSKKSFAAPFAAAIK